MTITENILQAFASLVSNKMRSFLTMLGIIIGIGSVIAILTVGDSMQNMLMSELSGFGANNIYLTVQARGEDDGRGGFMMAYDGGAPLTAGDLITDAMLDELHEAFPGELKAVSVSDSVGTGRTTDGRRYANVSLVGVNGEYEAATNMEITNGRFLNERDQAEGLRNAVITDRVALNMFGGSDPIGKTLTISTGSHVDVYTVVGVYKAGDDARAMPGQSEKDIVTNVCIPLLTARKATHTEGYASVTLLTNVGIDQTKFSDDVVAYFDRYYSRNPRFEVSAFAMAGMIETINNALKNVTLAIAAIAAIALLVGGIGVMNIMMVSITERTKEIGTRKAIGATNGEIRMQFIIEAMIICLVGGLIGIALGIRLASVAAALLGGAAAVSAKGILIATGFAMAVGLFFGYYPANRAAKMDPIDALRYE